VISSLPLSATKATHETKFYKNHISHFFYRIYILRRKTIHSGVPTKMKISVHLMILPLYQFFYLRIYSAYLTSARWKSILRCFIFIMILMSSQIFAGTVYYVDATNGNDSNLGTESFPWKTIQKAANTTVAGDTVIVKAGTYNERISESTSGSSGSSIQYIVNGTVNVQGFNISGNYVKVKGFNCNPTGNKWSSNSTGIYISGDYCIIEDNYISDAPYYAILLESTADNCTIRNNQCKRCAFAGMFIQGYNHLVESNEIEDTRCQVKGIEYDDADGIRVFGSNHTFRGNYIHNISYSNNPGYKPHIDAFQTWQGDDVTVAENCLFERNWIELMVSLSGWEHGTGWMLEGGAKNITIKNNVVKACRGVQAGNGSGFKILNNTFIGDLSFPVNHNPAGIWVDSISNSTIKNNTICEQPWMAIYSSGCSNLDIDYNSTYNSNGSIPGGTIQSHDLWARDPKFVSLTRGDYHLQSDSSCIDAGATLSEVANDYDGNSRPQGPLYDIGAYEYKGARAVTPVASFTAYPTQGASPLLVSFDASASYDPDGSITSYKWEFGDGGTGSGATTNHTYEKGGTFTAKLTVTDNANQSSSSTKTISAGSPPVASFVASPTAGRAPLTVNFDASSSYDPDGTIVSYSWNFGDGTSGTGKIVSHTYTKEGTFTATLTVKDDISLEGKTSQEIKISSTNVIASFTTSTRKGEAPLSVTFDASGSKPSDDNGKITSYAWDFGDGTGDSGIKVSHTYAKTGKFIATLKVTDDKSKTDSTSAEISVYSKPKALFSFSPTSGVAPLPVTLDASGSYDADGRIVSYLWSFGDGITGTGQKISHTYTKAGNFTVLLSVTDNEGYSDSLSKTIEVSPGTPPVASFVASPTAGRAPLAVNFDASASSDPDGTIASYSWSFGDGTSGTGKIVSHTYTREGTFTATLTVKDNGGLEAKTSQEIKISSTNVIASFTTSTRKGEAPLSVTFDASGSKPSDANGKITSYAWDFGDGTGDSGIKVSHTFARTGRFIASLKVTDDKSKTDSTSAEISVYSKPKALFSFSPTSGVAPLPVTLDASGSYDADGRIVSYLWSFGDGITGTGQKISHTYTKAGNLTIVLIVTDNDGYTDSLSKTIDIYDKPFPPLNVKVTKMIDKGRMRSEGGYIIEWSKNPLNEGKFNVVKYRIYRKKENQDNASFTLIVEVNSNIFVYEDSNLSTKENVKGYTYAISSLDDKGKESVLSSPASSQNLNSIVYSEPNKNFKYGEGKPIKGSKGSD